MWGVGAGFVRGVDRVDGDYVSDFGYAGRAAFFFFDGEDCVVRVAGFGDSDFGGDVVDLSSEDFGVGAFVDCGLFGG